ncbi:hypothetical protein GGS23DRAFT_599721 [Durotheca rogersii]|uniref:uncharacterized protein n=1 Tax=Durotheca rogersii TaxID=419775 RepID=UPI00221EABB2|nr:uncharacterized protein GGS23DRAFT_599721 [Durotheca rogersii]KAI5860061.1 hypothetical protein GGS23DRAFT_599721 [Durotheca rogersii]
MSLLQESGSLRERRPSLFGHGGGRSGDGAAVLTNGAQAGGGSHISDHGHDGDNTKSGQSIQKVVLDIHKGPSAVGRQDIIHGTGDLRVAGYSSSGGGDTLALEGGGELPQYGTSTVLKRRAGALGTNWVVPREHVVTMTRRASSDGPVVSRGTTYTGVPFVIRLTPGNAYFWSIGSESVDVPAGEVDSLGEPSPDIETLETGEWVDVEATLSREQEATWTVLEEPTQTMANEGTDDEDDRPRNSTPSPQSQRRSGRMAWFRFGC